MNKGITILISTLLLLCVISACSNIVPIFVSEKKRTQYEDIPKERRVHQFFWNTLHQGNYQNVDKVIDSLHMLYMTDPNDFKVAAHLGFAYAWSITERKRRVQLVPSISAHGDMAQLYFEKAYSLNDNDPRINGFRSGFMLANASRHNNDKMKARGYYIGKEAIRQWPSFNLFSIGYVMSSLPYETERYNEALDFQWENLEECLCRKIDRRNPDLSDIDQIKLRVKDDYKKSRACTNSWIAPHNVEGFLLNLGDMLVKANQIDVAIEVYNSIKKIDEYKEWPYQKALEYRLNNIEENVTRFRGEGDFANNQNAQFIRSTIACTGCHQKSVKEFNQQNDSIRIPRHYYFLD